MRKTSELPRPMDLHGECDSVARSSAPLRSPPLRSAPLASPPLPSPPLARFTISLLIQKWFAMGSSSGTHRIVPRGSSSGRAASIHPKRTARLLDTDQRERCPNYRISSTALAAARLASVVRSDGPSMLNRDEAEALASVQRGALDQSRLAMERARDDQHRAFGARNVGAATVPVCLFVPCRLDGCSEAISSAAGLGGSAMSAFLICGGAIYPMLCTGRVRGMVWAHLPRGVCTKYISIPTTGAPCLRTAHAHMQCRCALSRASGRATCLPSGTGFRLCS